MPVLAAAAVAALAASSSPLIGHQAPFPLAAPDDAWAFLPRDNPPLPAWARVLVRTLPRTTGAMLELDALHRAGNPLGPALAARLRWEAADAIGCDYARATAEADFRRAGATDEEVRQLADPPPGDRPLAAFARKMTRAAYTVSDTEFDALLRRYGPEAMTAVVHTLAFANFQNRIILALGVRVEAGGPCPPVEVKFDRARRAKVPTPARPAWDAVTAARPAKRYDAPADWKDIGFADLEQSLAAQKARKPRVPLPDPARFAGLPPDARKQTDTIVWMTVSAGYQPALTQAWFAALREFQQEARMDRVFSSSVFWVVTRANDCFY